VQDERRSWNISEINIRRRQIIKVKGLRRMEEVADVAVERKRKVGGRK